MIKKLTLSLVVPFALFGQNLNELIDMSLENRLIDSSTKTLQGTKLEYESSKKGYLPSLTLNGKYATTNKETSGVPDNATTIYGSLNYTLYDGGKRENTYDSYEASISSATKSLEDLKNQTALQVTNYYFNYLSLLAQKEAKQKEIEQLNAQYIRLKRFLEAGTTTDDEVQKIISRVESATVSLHEIELDIQTILHNLEYIVGKSVNINSGSKIENFISNEETLRADIKALEYDMQNLLSTAKSTKSANYPTVTLDNSLYRYDTNYETSTYASSSDEYTQNVFSVNLSWKLFDFGSTTKSYEAAYKKYLALKSSYEYERNKASVDLKLALKSYNIAKLKISSAKSGLKAANSAYESIEAKYQNGLVDNVAYLEALSEKFNAISSLKSAQYDLHIKQANIIYHSGKNLAEYIK